MTTPFEESITATLWALVIPSILLWTAAAIIAPHPAWTVVAVVAYFATMPLVFAGMSALFVAAMILGSCLRKCLYFFLTK